MKKPDNGIFLLHIASSLQKILQYLENVTKEEFFNNSLIQDAVIRNYEIIGEDFSTTNHTKRLGVD
ncbi:MAG: DUF86 domain-containing protein [Lentisphaerae bacterium]|jgi:uncharacterized protein with HEPN domain|nr:DUF86 domain-containing protein [Lentisphaerota bacterium]